jgi:hypothetical protein
VNPKGWSEFTRTQPRGFGTEARAFIGRQRLNVVDGDLTLLCALFIDRGDAGGALGGLKILVVELDRR